MKGLDIYSFASGLGALAALFTSVYAVVGHGRWRNLFAKQINDQVGVTNNLQSRVARLEQINGDSQKRVGP